jgi:hypothetical protein
MRRSSWHIKVEHGPTGLGVFVAVGAGTAESGLETAVGTGVSVGGWGKGVSVGAGVSVGRGVSVGAGVSVGFISSLVADCKSATSVGVGLKVGRVFFVAWAVGPITAVASGW